MAVEAELQASAVGEVCVWSAGVGVWVTVDGSRLAGTRSSLRRVSRDSATAGSLSMGRIDVVGGAGSWAEVVDWDTVGLGSNLGVLVAYGCGV